MDDVEALKQIRQAVGDEFPVMFDRTGPRAPWAWSYRQALEVARAMEEHGAYWLEEPFEREPYTYSFREVPPVHESPSYRSIARTARLRESVGLRITGGEGDNDTPMFAQYLINGAFDVLQPDSFLGGGILTCMKIGMMAQAFECDMIMHGTHGLRLAGALQVDAASPLPSWQELVMTTPGVLPQQTLAPGMRLLRNKDVFHIEDGFMHIPQGPGLGLEVDEDALAHYRVGSDAGSG
jgi:L-alanine-DL-glutamate epimerase-like enolase superfamily enzyme